MAKIAIDAVKCSACCTCIGVCQRGVLELDESQETATIKNANICLFCRDCLASCPTEAIYVAQ